MNMLSYLQIRTPKDDETTLDGATQIFASLLPSHISHFKRLWVPAKTYAFELYFISQMIYFYASVPRENETLVRSLISSSYTLSKIQKTTDPMDIVMKSKYLSVGELVLNTSYFYPIKTYAEFGTTDPLTSLIGFLSKQPPEIKIAIQILVKPSSFPWQADAFKTTKKATVDATGATKTVSNPEANKAMITKKAGFQGGRAAIRILVGSQVPQLPLREYLHNIAGTYGSFSLAEGNQFSLRIPLIMRDRLIQRVKERRFAHFERSKQILNAQELATLWHPPGLALSGIKNMAWGKTLRGEPPENLPIVENMSEEDKKSVNFFARTEFKNKDTIFGIKSADRGKHVYIMGKTGAGKSTLIANMAIDDVRKDRGIGIIDPHGDLCETVIDYIPKRRINDVVYLEPYNLDRPFSLNVLEVRNAQHKHLVASGIVSIFNKLYKESWGPRLEYILRNVVLTLLEIPNATLADVLPLLSQEKYRAKALERIQDQVVVDFWKKEFDKMPDRLKAEAISPIQNKVGQFVSSRMIRNIIGHPQSSISLEDIMDEGKILLLNLSQGKLGEDNAALLGSMIITQIQLAAMGRAFKKESERRDFFLYVDEFQNFATTSFLKILSEARKYHLALSLANQYIDQLEEDIQRAIFGNVGTLMSFVVGARDAVALSKEFAGLYSDNDLVSLGKHEIVLKLSIDGMTSFPFPAKTLPLPSLKNDNKEKIIKLSQEKYGRTLTDEPLLKAPNENEQALPGPSPKQNALPSPQPKPQQRKQPVPQPVKTQSQSMKQTTPSLPRSESPEIKQPIPQPAREPMKVQQQQQPTQQTHQTQQAMPQTSPREMKPTQPPTPRVQNVSQQINKPTEQVNQIEGIQTQPLQARPAHQPRTLVQNENRQEKPLNNTSGNHPNQRQPQRPRPINQPRQQNIQTTQRQQPVKKTPQPRTQHTSQPNVSQQQTVQMPQVRPLPQAHPLKKPVGVTVKPINTIRFGTPPPRLDKKPLNHTQLNPSQMNTQISTKENPDEDPSKQQ